MLGNVLAAAFETAQTVVYYGAVPLIIYLGNRRFQPKCPSASAVLDDVCSLPQA